VTKGALTTTRMLFPWTSQKVSPTFCDTVFISLSSFNNSSGEMLFCLSSKLMFQSLRSLAFTLAGTLISSKMAFFRSKIEILFPTVTEKELLPYLKARKRNLCTKNCESIRKNKDRKEFFFSQIVKLDLISYGFKVT
jgi:hypothetical protein